MRTDSDASQNPFETGAAIAPSIRKMALLLLLPFATVVSAGCDDPQPGDGAELPSLEVPDSGEPTDDLPNSDYVQIGATAEVTVGPQTYLYRGYTPAVWFDYLEQNGGTADGYVATCGFIESTDGTLIVTASFYKYENRSLYDSFSLVDDGSSTVIWGLNDVSKEQEWSAGGQDSVSLAGLRDTGIDYIYIEFEGTATENFSSERAPVTSVVTCLYTVRDS